MRSEPQNFTDLTFYDVIVTMGLGGGGGDTQDGYSLEKGIEEIVCGQERRSEIWGR